MKLPIRFFTQIASPPFIPNVSLTQLIAKIAKSYRLDCIETEILLIIMSENKSGQDIRESLGSDLKYPRALIDICKKLGIPTEVNISTSWEHYLKAYFQKRISLLTGIDFETYKDTYRSVGCGDYQLYLNDSSREETLSRIQAVLDTIHNPKVAIEALENLKKALEITERTSEATLLAFQSVLSALPSFVERIATTSEFSATDISLLILNEMIFFLRKDDIANLKLQEQAPTIRLFVGRSKEFRDFDEILESGVRTLLVSGDGGIGKSTLCRQYMQRNFDTCLEFPTARQVSDLADVEKLVEEKLLELGEAPGKTFKSSLSKLKKKCQTSRVGILINDLDSVIDQDGNFFASHRKYSELIRFLGKPNTKAVTFITSCQRLINVDAEILEYPLRGLSLTDWRMFFSISRINISNEELRWTYKIFSGNAREMKLLAENYRGNHPFNLLRYCLERSHQSKNLQKLIESAFDKLQLSDSSSSYDLLVRVGCYQPQKSKISLSTEFIECLLWEHLKKGKQDIIADLCERSFLMNGSDGHYTVHPSILKEARNRLANSEDWFYAHRKAAQYWSESITTISEPSDARKALEAYYHYFTIQDYERAAEILIQKRQNCFQTDESLVRSLYKLGFRDLVEEAINDIKDKLIPGYRRAKLIHTLGALAWLKGDIHRAISYCNESIVLAQQGISVLPGSVEHKENLRIKLEEVKLNANLTKGLCLMGLGELDMALQTLEHVVDLAKRINYDKYSPSPYFYIAYILSFEHDEKSLKRALSIANHLFTLYESMPKDCMPSWITEYRLYHLGLAFTNLGEFNKAFLIHQRVLCSEKHSLYEQAKTKHYNGLACYYREHRMFKKALHFHSLAIDSFKKLNAWVDLAEAYFQEAVTRREVGEINMSIECAERAVSLFSKMNATAQKKRVADWIKASFTRDFVI